MSSKKNKKKKHNNYSHIFLIDCKKNSNLLKNLIEKNSLTSNKQSTYNEESSHKDITESLPSEINESSLQFLPKTDFSRDFISYFPLIFPWNVDNRLNKFVSHLSQYKYPTFKLNIGLQGLAESFSFIMNYQEKWSSTSYFSTSMSLALLV